MKKMILIFFVSVCFCGCMSSHPPLPKSWGKISKESECPRLDGTYYNRGEIARFPDDSTYLSRFLVSFDSNPISSPMLFITVEQSENELLIIDNSHTLGTVHFNSQDCRGGFLKISVPNTEGLVTYKQAPVVTYAYKYIILTKGEDGSIIILEGNKIFGFFLIMPGYSHNYYWHRFRIKAD